MRAPKLAMLGPRFAAATRWGRGIRIGITSTQIGEKYYSRDDGYEIHDTTEESLHPKGQQSSPHTSSAETSRVPLL